ncbi:MAG: hypothetical protein C0417_05140 [Chlorobiaceae bacterium]|nr:hypothetical protein [Chlorobiaceae bacterium]
MFSFNRTILILLAVVLLAGCKKEQPTEPAKSVIGFYESSRFIEPGSTDGGVDIQSSGGYFQLGLNENNDFTAELFIPKKISSNYPKGISKYSGKYVVSSDTIKFISIDFILENIQWKKGSGQLETFEVPMRGQPFKIVFNKYLR